MSRRKQIWFDTNKNGKQIAYHWDRLGMRSFRMSLDEATLLIATGQADRINGRPLPRMK